MWRWNLKNKLIFSIKNFWIFPNKAKNNLPRLFKIKFNSKRIMHLKMTKGLFLVMITIPQMKIFSKIRKLNNYKS